MAAGLRYPILFSSSMSGEQSILLSLAPLTCIWMLAGGPKAVGTQGSSLVPTGKQFLGCCGAIPWLDSIPRGITPFPSYATIS